MNRDQFILTNQDKEPVNPHTGYRIDPHDPASWMSRDEAQRLADAAGLEVAYVITADEPTACIDIDGCRDPITGAYDERAQRVFAALPGVGVEISRSERGLHFWFCCEAGMDERFMNRANGIEFYQSGRYIILGSAFQGDPSIDATMWLPNVLTPREAGTDAALPASGPVPEYTGPSDDALLIQMALGARGSVAGMFGDKARFPDLWSGSAALGRFFPTDTDDLFDRSAADAALLAHLAFWTGKDQERMRRLWLASPLAQGRPDQKKLQRKDYVERTVKGVVEKTDSVYTGARSSSTQDATSDRLVGLGTHHDMALAFANETRGNLCYDTDKKVWLRFDGIRWCEQIPGNIVHEIRLFSDLHSQPGARNPRSTGFISSVEKLVQADPDFAHRAIDFDRDNYLLNTPEGTIDLRTGETRSHSADDMISKSTITAPQESAASRWFEFVDEICCGDTELVEALQTLLGACLSGAIEDHWFCFAYGTGRNGKNVLFDTVRWVLGDYAVAAPASLITLKKHEDHKEGIARLRGARLVVASEVEANSHFAEAFLKDISGNETLTARVMHGNTFEFKRTFKICVLGNHKPRSRNADPAFIARLKLVPFKANFTNTADPNLTERLKQEAPVILQWLIEGHTKWLEREKSVGTCSAMKAELRNWEETQLSPAQWIDEALDKVPDDGRSNVKWPKSADLYKIYKSWAQFNGAIPLGIERWCDQMERAGFKRVKSNGIRYKFANIKSPISQNLISIPGGKVLPQR
jgi:P4 family phage/plasmid primase-like protien